VFQKKRGGGSGFTGRGLVKRKREGVLGWKGRGPPTGGAARKVQGWRSTHDPGHVLILTRLSPNYCVSVTGGTVERGSTGEDAAKNLFSENEVEHALSYKMYWENKFARARRLLKFCLLFFPRVFSETPF